MANNMFCFQCEQTAGGKGCVTAGVCGKNPETANNQDELTAALIDLARAAGGKSPSKTATELVIQGLFTTVTNVNFDPEKVAEWTAAVKKETAKLNGSAAYPAKDLWVCAAWQPMPGMLMFLARKMLPFPTGFSKA
jgi:hydroxylamine reductase